LNSYTRAQISIELYAALSAVLLMFLASLVFTMQMRRSEEASQINAASLMLAQQIANSADLMQRNLCSGGGCSLSLMLPKRIRCASFSKEVDYNISFRSNWVVLTPEGYPAVSIAASIPLEGLRVSINQTDDGKLLRMEGNG
jgi:hypothetical protein